MYTYTALSLALVAAAVAPVISVPVAPQPTQSFAPLTPAELGIVPGPFATDTPEQLQQIANQIHDAWVSVNPPVPVPTTNPAPEKRQFGALFGAIAKGAAEAAAKVGKDKAKDAIKSAVKRAAEPTPIVEPLPGHPFFGHGPVVLHDAEHDAQAVRRSIFGAIAEGIAKAEAKFGESQAQAAIQSALKRAPAPTPVAQPIHDSPGLEELNEHQKRQLGALFGLLAKGVAEAAGKFGKDEAKDAIKSAIKRSPAPTPVAQPIHDSFPGLEEELNEHQKRQLGALFGLIGKGAAKAAGKFGMDEAKAAVKSAVNKRAPAPTPVSWAA